jgi:hypothetical protein
MQILGKMIVEWRILVALVNLKKKIKYKPCEKLIIVLLI